MADGRVGTAVLELRTDNDPLEKGLAEAEGRVERFRRRASQAGQTLQAQNRVAIRAVGDFAQILSGTAALLSIATRGNDEWRDRLEKVTVALALTSTALNIYRNYAQLAQASTVALRLAVAALTSSAGIGALIVLGTTLIGVLAGLTMWNRRAMDAADEHGESVERLGRRVSGLGGLTVAELQEIASSSRLVDDATKSIEQLKDELRQAGEEADDAEKFSRKLSDTFQRFRGFAEEAGPAIHGLGLKTRELLGQPPLFFDPEQYKKEIQAVKDAAKELERLQEVENETNDQLLQDEAMRQAGDALRRLDDETKNLVLDARDYARVAREEAAAQEAFNQWVRDTIPPLIEQAKALEGASSEGAHARAWMGQFVQENADAAAFVAGSWKTTFPDIAGHLTTFAAEGIAVAEDMAEKMGPSAAIVYLQSWRDALEATGRLTDEAAEQINQVMVRLFGLLHKTGEKALDLGATFTSAFIDAFSTVARQAETFGDAILSIINSLLDALFRHVGGSLFAYLFPNIKPAQRQHGGPLAAFQPAIVGERGAELFVPRVAGQVIPHNDLVGGGGMQIFVDARGAERGVGAEVQRAIAEMGEQAVRASVAKVQDQVLRGGSSRNLLRR